MSHLGYSNAVLIGLPKYVHETRHTHSEESIIRQQVIQYDGTSAME